MGRDGSEDSICCLRDLRSARQARVRGEPWMLCGLLLRVRLSPSAGGYFAEHDAVVYARRELWDSVTESEELVGRLRAASLFPQYLYRKLKVVR